MEAQEVAVGEEGGGVRMLHKRAGAVGGAPPPRSAARLAMPAELTGGAGTAARPALEWTGGEGQGRRRGAAGGTKARAQQQRAAAAAAHPLVRVVLVLVVAR